MYLLYNICLHQYLINSWENYCSLVSYKHIKIATNEIVLHKICFHDINKFIIILHFRKN